MSTQNNTQNNNFSIKQSNKSPVNKDNLLDINNELHSISRRIRMIEERYYNIRKKTQLTDQNMIEDNKKINVQLKYFSGSIKDLKKKIFDISEKLSMFDEELKETAKKRDLTLINKYLDFWEPMSFLSEKDALKIINDVLNDIGLNKKSSNSNFRQI